MNILKTYKEYYNVSESYNKIAAINSIIDPKGQSSEIRNIEIE